jgi:hypothetical protein
MRKLFALVSGMVAALVVALPVFAVETADLDWSADITTGLAGITAGVAASIGAVFLVAVLIRVTFKAARLTMKSLGFIK